MGTKRSFLGFLTFLFIAAFAGNAFAAGYTCSTKTYTSCASGYYLDGGQCKSCSSGCTCAGGTAQPVCCSTSRACSSDFSGYSGTYNQCTGNQSSQCYKSCTKTCSGQATCYGDRCTYNTSDTCSGTQYYGSSTCNGTCTCPVSTTYYTCSGQASCPYANANCSYNTSAEYTTDNTPCPVTGIASCKSGFHLEGGACVSNTKACTSTAIAAGTQTWNGSSWGGCVATSCNSGYYLSSGSCTHCNTVSAADLTKTETISNGSQGYTCSGKHTGGAGGTSGSGSCTGCSSWTLSTVTCTEGYYKNTSNTCTKCGTGYYCDGGTYSASSSIAGRSSCSSLASGFYPNSAAGSDAASDCYTNSISGKYVASANASSATNCAAGDYKASHTVYYGSTSSCNSCSSLASGFYPNSRAGSDAATDCYTNAISGAYIKDAKDSTTTPCEDGSYKVLHTVYYNSTSTCSACSALSGVSVAGGDYASVSPRTMATNCRYTAPQQSVPENCYSISSNTVAYTSSGWNTSTFSVTALAKFFVSANNVAAPMCSALSYGRYSADGNTTTTDQGTGACTNAPTDSTYTSAGDTETSCAWQCNADHYKNGSSCPSCDAGLSAPAGSTSSHACTRACTTSDVANSVDVSGTYYQDTGNASCLATACQTGYSLNSGVCGIITYNISYALNGGQNPADAVATYTVITPTFDLPEPMRVGYTFDGWYETDSFEGSVVEQISVGATGDRTYYAKWTANKYDVTYECGTGTGSAPAQVQATYDSTFTPAANSCAKTGYSFAGWAISDTAVVALSAFIWQYPEAKTFTAQWTPNVYSVVLDDQSATVAPAPTTFYLKYDTGWFADSAANSSLTKLTTVPVKTAYAFEGFYTAQTGGVQIIDASGNFLTTGDALQMTIANDTVIYARWAADKMTCAAGTYYSGYAAICEPCEENNYCEGGTFATDTGNIGGREQCPDNGFAPAESQSSAACYQTGLEYDLSHGRGTQTCYYNESSDGYDDRCLHEVVIECHPGYWWAVETDHDCSAVTDGYFSAAKQLTRDLCPNGGVTETATAVTIDECFKRLLVYTAEFGAGTQTCSYTSGDGSAAVYDRDCRDKKILTCVAGYWHEYSTDIDCVMAEYNYYSPEDDLLRYECPAGGETRTETARAPAECLIPRQTYISTYGAGHRACYYTSGEGDSAVYDTSCSAPVMTSCLGGYYYNGTEDTMDCIKVGVGYYSEPDSVIRARCPAGGLTETETTSAVDMCYRTDMVCPVDNGVGESICNYNTATQQYDDNCGACTVTMCNLGYYQVLEMCPICPAGSVCANKIRQSCADLTNNKYTMSDKGMYDISSCYTDCALAENATKMSGRDYYNLPDTCVITQCKAGYWLNNGKCEICPAGSICHPDVDNGNPQLCSAVTEGTHTLSEKGSSEKAHCYKECPGYPVDYGTAVAYSDTVFWQEECSFYCESVTEHLGDIVDNVCVERSCRGEYEMISGRCELCARENALAYKTTGNCQVSACKSGYHPQGDKCGGDVVSCDAPNALSAEQTWDAKRGAYTVCLIKECESGYHVESNACEPDIQPCSIENGIGEHEWNHNKQSWNECVAVSCNPGYTSDKSEMDLRDGLKACGRCRNAFGVNGELAVNQYRDECEIASCLYQGQLYDLQNNECVPICEIGGYSDETGSRKWNPATKKCEFSCNPGYLSW